MRKIIHSTVPPFHYSHSTESGHPFTLTHNGMTNSYTAILEWLYYLEIWGGGGGGGGGGKECEGEKEVRKRDWALKTAVELSN